MMSGTSCCSMFLSAFGIIVLLDFDSSNKHVRLTHFMWSFKCNLLSFPFFFFVCSVMSDCVTPWIIAHQAPLSMGFSRQEYWNGLPFPSLGDLPNPGIEPVSLAFPALSGGFFITSTTWEACYLLTCYKLCDRIIFLDCYCMLIALISRPRGRIATEE